MRKRISSFKERDENAPENVLKTEGKVWVEYLWDGAWIMKQDGNKLLGYLVKNDPCCFSEDDEPYEEGLVSTFVDRAKEMGLEPVETKCVGEMFDETGSEKYE